MGYETPQSQKKISKIPGKVTHGLSLFNKREFYQAHEYFEDAWRETPDNSREFYRALLHISGGFYRLTQGRPVAAEKFFRHAVRWLENYPQNHLGFKPDEIKQYCLSLIRAIDHQVTCEDILKNHFQLIKRIPAGGHIDSTDNRI